MLKERYGGQKLKLERPKCFFVSHRHKSCISTVLVPKNFQIISNATKLKCGKKFKQVRIDAFAFQKCYKIMLQWIIYQVPKERLQVYEIIVQPSLIQQKKKQKLKLGELNINFVEKKIKIE